MVHKFPDRADEQGKEAEVVRLRTPPRNIWIDWMTGTICDPEPIEHGGQLITIAGLWSNWNDKASGEDLKSCTMVITEPNKFVAEFHDRMPVILEAKDFEQWEQGEVKDAAALMKPAGENLLQKWPVSKRVNNSRTSGEDATLIEKVVA